MIQKFEESRAKSKKRGEKKPKVEEIQKPRGYERGLAIEQIVGATDVTGDVSYLIKWQFCDEFDLVPGAEVREKNPELILDFYERRSPYQRVINERLLGVPDELRIINASFGSGTAIDVAQQLQQELNDVDAVAAAMGDDQDLQQSLEQDLQHDLQTDLHDSVSSIENAAVSYSIPVPGVGNIAIDVPILDGSDIAMH